MNRLAVCVVAIAGASMSAHAQLMKFLVSKDGVNFSNQVNNAVAGDTIQVLVTVSYTGTSTAVAGFGSADFQPIVSNWRPSDTLLPIRQGGNELPNDGSGMIAPQFYTGVSAGDSSASYGHIHAAYVPGTFGRVLPMGRTYAYPGFEIRGFVHPNPDGSGQTYLRLAQANNPAWIGAPGNLDDSGVNPAQLYVVGRNTTDPDFWGNRETVFDPDLGWTVTSRIAANDSRRLNVEVFRFGFTLDSSPTPRAMTIDAPLAGQQGFIGYYTSPSQPAAGLRLTPVVQTATILVNIPAPAGLSALGLIGLASARRRRRASVVGS